MAPTTKPGRRVAKKSPAGAGNKVQRHRDNMRRRGFKLVQIWVPDPNSPGFAEECRRQSRLIARTPSERGGMRDLEALQEGVLDGWGWKE